MTTTNLTRSTPAHRIAVIGAAVLAVVATTVLVTTSRIQDADARPSAERSAQDAAARERARDRRDALRWDALIAEAAETERIRAANLQAFSDAVTAEAARVAAQAAFFTALAEAERARVAKAEASRASMGGGWAALRRCESGGNYGAVSATGTYRGAYQFSRSTWNAVAARSHPRLVGVDPAAAAPADQDAMAMSLYRSSGSRPWPHCGRHL